MTTVLVVDDEPDIRMVLRWELELHGGFTVLEASTGAEALEKHVLADVVLLDIRLPDIDGFEVMRRLPPDHPPVIALSAHARSVGADAALEVGCVAYLTKPYDAAQLVALIREQVPGPG